MCVYVLLVQRLILTRSHLAVNVFICIVAYILSDCIYVYNQNLWLQTIAHASKEMMRIFCDYRKLQMLLRKWYNMINLLSLIIWAMPNAVVMLDTALLPFNSFQHHLDLYGQQHLDACVVNQQLLYPHLQTYNIFNHSDIWNAALKCNHGTWIMNR